MGKVEIKFVRCIKVIPDENFTKSSYAIGETEMVDPEMADKLAAQGFAIHLKTEAVEIETKEDKPKRTRKKKKTETK